MARLFYVWRLGSGSCQVYNNKGVLLACEGECGGGWYSGIPPFHHKSCRLALLRHGYCGACVVYPLHCYVIAGVCAWSRACARVACWCLYQCRCYYMRCCVCLLLVIIVLFGL